jgi:hypothetical protein
MIDWRAVWREFEQWGRKEFPMGIPSWAVQKRKIRILVGRHSGGRLVGGRPGCPAMRRRRC